MGTACFSLPWVLSSCLHYDLPYRQFTNGSETLSVIHTRAVRQTPGSTQVFTSNGKQINLDAWNSPQSIIFAGFQVELIHKEI